MDKPVIVEFVGLPGAGKSTICTALRKSLSEQGLPVWTRQDYWSFGREGKGVLCNALRYFGLMKTVAMNVPLILQSTLSWRKTLSVFSLGYKLFVLKCFLMTVHEREVLRRLQHSGVALVDEGALQRAYTIFFHFGALPDTPKLATYVSRIWPPDILVYLKISAASALARLQSRELPVRMQQMSAEQKAVMLKDGEKFLERLVDMAKGRPESTVLEFDGEDIVGATMKLQRFLEQQLAGSGSSVI
jgi:hypothetical protein